MATATEAMDRLTIMERLNRYAWGYDVPDLEMLRDSFTSDASFLRAIEGRQGVGTAARARPDRRLDVERQENPIRSETAHASPTSRSTKWRMRALPCDAS